MTLEEIAKQVAQCSKCPLRFEATSPVMGVGEVGAKYFLLGEAPGRTEDSCGVPFVGLAGKRLNKLLELANIDINDCYLTNVCKCRPPQNRTPRKSERLSCYPFLRSELSIIKPSYIIALGATPLGLFSSNGVRDLHGTQFQYADEELGELTILSQYHPAAALHQPRLWAVMLDDWQHLPEKVDASYTVLPIGSSSNKAIVATKDIKVLALDTENDEKGTLGQWSIAFRGLGDKLYVMSTEGTRECRPTYEGQQVIMHNAKWDLRVLARNKMPVPENVVDTMICAYVLGLGRQDAKTAGESGDKMVGGLGLKYLARRHLGMTMKSWHEVKDNPDEMQEYNAADSVATFLLWEKWKPQLPEHFWTIDMPLLKVLMAMEDRGISVDPKFLQKYAETLDKKLAEAKDELPLNPFSHQQVSDYVYGQLGYTPTKFTDSKQPSVDKEVLETIDDPIVRRILEYREFYKERKTYVSAYISRMDIENRIHCDFKQTSTATGRLSSARPNLQNVTQDTEEKPSSLRDLFVASKGNKLVRVDWERLELWTFGAMLGRGRMLDGLVAGRDPHQETGDFLGIPRHEGRNVNFLMLYGGTAWRISQEFGVPIDRAKAMIAQYYKAYPEIKEYHEKMVEIAHNERKVTNFFGRTRRLDGMYSEHFKTMKDTEREAINTPIQGAAAEIVKLAMIDLHYKHSAPLILNVHDELVFELPIKEADEYAVWLKEYIPTITEINGVKFPIEVGCGRTWKEAKENSK